jgi:RNA polymerase sigma-70 factor (ECF subfamily)
MPRSKKTYESLQESKAHVVPIGKEQTFNYFFRQYFVGLCFFAQSIIHNEEDAKDIVQDCFIKLWDDAASEEKTETVKSFLYTMVRNRCIDYVRKQKVITKATQYLQNDKDDSEYLDELAFAEMMRQIFKHIEELPANMSTILKKYYLQGKKHKEIANELSTTTNAVKLQKSRAIKLLKQRLLFFVSLMFIFFRLFLIY